MDKTYFLIKLDKKYIRFWCMPVHKMMEVLDSYYIKYSTYNSLSELSRACAFKKMRIYYRNSNDDMLNYVIVGLDRTCFWAGKFVPGIVEDLCSYYNIEYYSFVDTDNKEYKSLLKELNKKNSTGA